ncbi:MAG TPA: TetR/AcrR family transcriptional regulator [Rhodobiaceae bacterium]|jgi:AcrR family transcriptional regulator|nr:TetR/AcrR family transcriptional regulator [Rhodobiaceae bacterium]
MSESDTTREKIIVAARERFSHYGYPKTTIAELAEDCAMSPGNIYRFFKGKIDIAVEIARREALSAVEVIEAVLDCPLRSSRQRLEEVVFADLRYTFHLLENQPKTLELAQIVVSDRPQFQIESLRRERRVFQRILHEGQASGEFMVDNVPATTIALHAATTKYRYAQLFTNQTLAELERELAHVMTVIMRGLMPTSEGHAVAETQIPDETTALSFAASAVAAADTENRNENEMKTGTEEVSS